MKVRINENMLRSLVKESIAKMMKESGDESYLDFNNNVYDDPSVAKAYVDGGDKAVEHIRPTHRQSMKSGMGSGIDYSAEDIEKIVAEAIRKVISR